MKEEDFVKARREQEGADDGGWKPGIGQLLGVVIALILIVGSIILGLTTGIGLVFAVPIAVVGIVIGFLFLKGGARPRMISAPCPYCGTTVVVPSHISEVGCESCGAQVEVRQGRLYRAG